MTWFHVRWGGVLLAGLAIVFLGMRHYQRELRAISPLQLREEAPSGTIRVRGLVLPGTLFPGPGPNEARFELEGDGSKISVHYKGGDPENLRELKTLVVIGRWDPGSKLFEAREIGVVPNFGFVTAAYLAGIVPVGLFLFWMEHRVAFLYREIRDQKVYEPGGDEG